MLIVIGPDVTSAQDYTERIAAQSIQIVQNQGDTLDTMKCVINDPYSVYGVGVEDEIYVLEEDDPNGWPTTNLAVNPDFSGSYTNGGTTAPNWTISPYPSTGITFAKSTAGGVNGGTAQQITVSNMSASTPTFYDNVVTLPQDEFGNPLTRYPYYFSLYINQTATPVNLNVLLRIDWYDINGTAVGSSSATTVPAANTGYVRYWVNAAPPTGAYSARARVRFQGTSATNSGTFRLDNAQFEYATFYSYQAMGFKTALVNAQMDGTLGAAYCDGWQPYNSGNTTASVISAPTLHHTAQQITLTNVTPSGTICGMQQQQIRLYKLQNYTMTLRYFVTGAFSANMSVSMSLHMYDNALNDLGNFSLDGPVGEGITNAWQAITLRFGPNLTNALHPSAVYYAVHLGLIARTGSSTNNGTVAIGEFTVTPDTTLQYAGLVGIYPTAYCDQNQAGCYFDSVTGKPYRQWRYFGGFVRNAVYDHSMSGDRYIEIDATDFSVLLQEAPATLLILDSVDSDAINQACTYAHNVGFLQGLDWTTHVASIGQVNAMLFNWRSTRDVLTEIANQTIAAYWVDPYKFLWYQPALATSAPFGLSDQPDPSGVAVGIPTYQMSGLKWNQDSTETVTAPVIEGSTQLSAPQTFTGSGATTTTTSALTSGTPYSSIPVVALTHAIAAGSDVFISDGTNSINVTVGATANVGATSIAISPAVTPSNTIATSASVGVDGYVLNNFNPIAQIDSVTVGGVAQGPIGLFSTNTYAQGYTCLVDLAAGVLYFQTAPANGSNNVVIVYRYAAPVIVRLTVPYVGGPTKPRRKISSHQKEDHITSQQAAIDRANAELQTSAQARPVGDIVLMSPPVPFSPGLHAGQAIQVWFAKANQTPNRLFAPGQLFQIQSNTIQPMGNGVFKQTLKVGFYQPDFAVYMAQIQRDNMESTDNNNTILQDILTTQDSMILSDALTFRQLNTASWYSGTPASNSFGWGPVVAPRQQGVWG